MSSRPQPPAAAERTPAPAASHRVAAKRSSGVATRAGPASIETFGEPAVASGRQLAAAAGYSSKSSQNSASAISRYASRRRSPVWLLRTALPTSTLPPSANARTTVSTLGVAPPTWAV